MKTLVMLMRLIYKIEASPKRAMPRGMPRLPVLPIITQIVMMDFSLISSLKNIKAITELISTQIKEIVKYQKGACRSETSMGLLERPQKESIGCKK